MGSNAPSGQDEEPTESVEEALPTARVSADEKSGGGKRKPARKSFRTRLRRRWRAWLRAVHRDIGYLAVGLTFVYALSGIAINHLGDWDPNFAKESVSHSVPLPISPDEEEAAAQVLAALEVSEEPREFFYETDTQLEIFFDDKERTFVVDTSTGKVTETFKSERFFLRVANWLHYNRGKAAWTYIADGYAVFLLFLAISGVFMLKGRKGIIGRGAVLVAAGALVPILYVHFASGP